MVVSSPQPRSFTHIGPGTPASVWRRHPMWTSADPLLLDRVARLVVVAAHPDDESLGAGGLIATAVRRGILVDIVSATHGEGSHPDSPTTTPDALATLRSGEALRAAAALGVPGERVHQLGLPDGGVDSEQDLLTRRLVEIVGDGRDTVLVAPWRRDGHPDHEAAGRAACAAARRTGADLWEFPVWFWHWGQPAEAPWTLLHPFELDEPAARAKAQAVGAHATQVRPLSDLSGDETLLVPEMLAHFAGPHEHFLRTASTDCVDDSLDRLHEEQTDPWGTESRWYEQRKRDLVLAMLPAPEFAVALEVGCSTGALAEALAGRAGRVVAVDRSVAALAAARRRFGDESRVDALQLDVPHDWPQDLTFDLVVVSEVGYFLSPAELDGLVDRIVASLAPGGVVVLCHWRHEVEGWVMDADDVHRGFEDTRLPPLSATYRDRDVEIRVHAAPRRLAGPAPVRRSIEVVHVVVPARDEAARLPRLLASLEAAALRVLSSSPGLEVRVTVVLDSCVDASRCVLRCHPWVDVLAVDSGVVGNVRARGVERARAMATGLRADQVWIACTDADSEVPPHWLSEQLDFAERGHDLVVGAVHPDPSDLTPQVVAAWRDRHRLHEGHPHVHGANLGLTLAAYDVVGGFAPLRTGEDVRLVEDLQEAGVHRVSTARNLVLTSGRRVARAPHGFAAYLQALPTG